MYVRIITFLCVALIVVSPQIAAANTNRAVDITASKVRFSISHVFVERVNGTVPIASGSASFAGDSPIPASVTVTLDATKVSTGDPDQTGCIQSPDYFDVKKFPTWTFTSTKITANGAASFAIDGTLTMHGVAQPEHLDVTILNASGHQVYHAVGKVDRHLFGMKGSRLDPAIGGIAEVTLDVVLK
ncbi:MAG TPA: YceI family protein [Candidatus Acidoferrales bacterium]|nr:YceI family protein [Candidatus Acidoferrales bacterium]